MFILEFVPKTNQTFIMFVMTVYKCCVTLQGQIHHAMPVWRLFLRDGVAWFIVVFGKSIFVIRQHISDVSSCRRHGALDMGGHAEGHAETIACGVSLAFIK
jgi:hypothetical protein